MTLFFSVVLLAAAGREYKRGNAALGWVMAAIPLCYWVSLYLAVPA